MKKIAITIDEDTLKNIDALAEKMKMTRSGAIRVISSTFFDSLEGADAEKNAAGKRTI